MRRLLWGKAGFGGLMVLVLMASAGLRIWGSDFGLPAYTRYHPDEHALVERAAEILWTGDWNLRRFNYPPAYAYVQAVAYSAYFVWGVAQGAWDQIMPFALPQYYHIGRLVTAVCGTLSVLTVYLVGRQFSGRRVGVLASALLGGCYLHVVHSHYATFDVMTGFMAILTLLFSELVRTQRKTRWYFLAGLFAGLAGTTKYNGVMAAVMPVTAHILATRWGEWGYLNGRFFVGIAGFLAGSFVGNPFALTNLPDFLNGLATVLHHYGTDQPGFEGSGNWRWYLRAFLASADRFWVTAGVAGLVTFAVQHWRKGVLLLGFPVIYYLLISSFVVRFERNMVPLLPFLALGGGWLLHTLADRLVRRLKWDAHLSHVLAALGLALLLCLPLVASAGFDSAISQTDVRETAGRWVDEHLEEGSKIAIEHYSVPFDHTTHEVNDVIRVSDHPLAWYQREGFDILIISDGIWEVLLSQRESYPQKVAIYEQLVTSSTLLAEFVPHSARLVVSGYPTIGIYHFAPVRIYRLPQ